MLNFLAEGPYNELERQDIQVKRLTRLLSNWEEDIAVTIKYNVPVQVPVGVSNRHIHLSQADVETLFGVGYQLTEFKPLLQPGQYACKEVLTVAGPKGVIHNVRVLGPVRKQTQVEVSRTDAFSVGVQPPVRDSGDLKGSAACVLIGPKGSVILREGVILAARHIHCSQAEAKVLQLKDKDRVNIAVGGERGIVFQNVQVRASENMRLELHVDTDEANACLLKSGDVAYMVEKATETSASPLVVEVKELVRVG